MFLMGALTALKYVACGLIIGNGIRKLTEK